MRALLLIGLLLCLPAIGCDEALSFDAQGVAHGTGQRTYAYSSGATQLVETYEDGKLVRSRWYRPDGSLIQETRWVDGTGEGLYLREDGSVRTRMNYVGGVAEGEARDYDQAENITGVRLFRNGQEIESSPGVGFRAQ